VTESRRTYYLAAGLKNESVMRVHALMREANWECTYDWSKTGSVKSKGRFACMEVSVSELAGVDNAQVMILLLPGGRGTHVELGAAIARGKPVIVHGPDELFGFDDKTSAFYHHPLVVRAPSLEELPTAAESSRLMIHFGSRGLR